ncbi:MAG: hypothetical protein OCC46_12100 [Pseudodesulfovibrio sp.]
MYRLICLLLCACLLCACAEKKGSYTSTASSEFSSTMVAVAPHLSIPLPSNWKFVEKTKILASPGGRTLVEGDEGFSSLYTGAPTADPRFPMLITFLDKQGVLSNSEIEMFIPTFVDTDMLLKQVKHKHIVHRKNYNPEKKLIQYKITVLHENGSFESIIAGYLTKQGLILMMGMCAVSDNKTIEIFEHAMLNAQVDESIRYD